MSNTNYKYVKLTVDDGIARVVLSRPEKRNAQSLPLLQELDQALQAADKDEAVRVIVLAAEGDHFSAGHDLKEAQEKRSNFDVEDRWAYEDEYYFGYCMRILELKKPTIAEVQGGCIAAGFMVANMCDLVVASDDAYFSDPVVQSIGAAAVEVLIHPWVMGVRAAKEFLFTGQRLSAQDALRLGIVNRVVPRADLTAEVTKLGAQIAKASPFALKLTKKSLNRTLDIMGLRSALEGHFDTHQLSHAGREAMQKFSTGVDKTIADVRQSSKEAV